jgi:type IX secretion system PorP/SprF family membrane protein
MKRSPFQRKILRKTTRTYYLLVTLWVFGCVGIYAQDALFTQMNMAPMHYNPAFTGNTYAPLIHLNSRIQWPGVGLAYQTVAASYDQYFKNIRSGFGAYVMSDREGEGIYNSFRLEALYAYRLRVHRGGFLKLGLSMALGQKRLNWNKLVFYDQLDPDYGLLDAFGNPNTSTDLPPDQLSILYPDLSVGLLYFSEDFYVGMAIKHSNSPEQNFLPSGSQEENGLALRYALQVGGQITLDEQLSRYIHPMLVYTRQASLHQASVLLHVNIGTIYAGLGYRHAFENPDALLLTAGMEWGMYTIAYSYDHTVSSLSANTWGAHEIGLRINFDGTEWFEPPYRYSDCFEVFR